MITIASSTKNNSKVFTQFKLFWWLTTLLSIGFHSGITMKSIHLLGTHEEYYPEYFLPESVLKLLSLLVMLIIFLCEYPYVYSIISTSRQSRFSYKDVRNLKLAKFRDLISCHLSALGWAGMCYGIQMFALGMVYIVVSFFANPLDVFIGTMGAILIATISVIIIHELYQMIRHPKYCCHCKNHFKILFCVAVALFYFGLASCLFLLLKHYQDLSPLLDSTKLVQYLISSACIALLGYFGKNKINEILKESEDSNRGLTSYGLVSV